MRVDAEPDLRLDEVTGDMVPLKELALRRIQRKKEAAAAAAAASASGDASSPAPVTSEKTQESQSEKKETPVEAIPEGTPVEPENPVQETTVENHPVPEPGKVSEEMPRDASGQANGGQAEETRDGNSPVGEKSVVVETPEGTRESAAEEDSEKNTAVAGPPTGILDGFRPAPQIVKLKEEPEVADTSTASESEKGGELSSQAETSSVPSRDIPGCWPDSNRYSQDFLLKFKKFCYEVPREIEVTDIYRGRGGPERGHTIKVDRGNPRGGLGGRGRGGGGGGRHGPSRSGQYDDGGGLRRSHSTEFSRDSMGTKKPDRNNPRIPRMAPLLPGENAWQPKEEKDALKRAMKKTRGILNKLSPEKYEKLKKQLFELNLSENETKMKKAIGIIFEKAINEPHFASMYTTLCKDLATLKVVNEGGSSSSQEEDAQQQQAEQNFRRLLILKVQKKFEKEEDPVPENLEGDELEELLYRRRKLRLGIMTFIGELFKAGMLNDRIMHSVIRELLRIPAAQSSAAENELPEENAIELVCKLMTLVGSQLARASDKSSQFVAYYVNRMKSLSCKDQYCPRIQFLLEEVVELKSRNWEPRRKQDKAKTLDEVRKEIAIEEAEQSRKANRHKRGGSSGSMGFGRGGGPGHRGTPSLPSPSSSSGWSVAPTRGRGTGNAAPIRGRGTVGGSGGGRGGAQSRPMEQPVKAAHGRNVFDGVNASPSTPEASSPSSEEEVEEVDARSVEELLKLGQSCFGDFLSLGLDEGKDEVKAAIDSDSIQEKEMGPFLAGGFFRSIAGRVTDGDRENLGTLFVEWCPDVFSVEAVVDSVMICLNKIGKEDMLSDGPKIPQWFCAVYGGVLSKIFTVDSEQFRAVVSSLVEVRNKFSLKTSFICAIIASSLKDVPSELRTSLLSKMDPVQSIEPADDAGDMKRIAETLMPLEDSHIGVFLLSSFVTGREPDAIIHRLKDEELGGRILVRKIFWSYMLFALTSPRGIDMDALNKYKPVFQYAVGGGDSPVPDLQKAASDCIQEFGRNAKMPEGDVSSIVSALVAQSVIQA